MNKNKWNEIINYCENNKIKPNLVKKILGKYINRKGYRRKWLEFRFDLYAKERIKQLNEGVMSTKLDTVRRMVKTNKFENEFKKIPFPYKEDPVMTFYKLLCEKRYGEEMGHHLLNAFRNNGKDKVI